MSDHETLMDLYRKYEDKDAQHINQDEVFTDLERHASRIWEKARENNWEDALEEEGTPKPTSLRSEYGSVMFDDEDAFDFEGFKKVFRKLDGAENLVSDLIAGF